MAIHIIPIKLDRNKHPGKQMQDVLDKAERYLKNVGGPLLVDALEATTENWESAPTFKSEYKEPYGTSMVVEAKPTGKETQKWRWVSEGTKPRTISVRRAKFLVFPRDYIPHTFPVGRYGGPGSRQGPIQYRKSVNWPGIIPREFSLKIKERLESKIVADFSRYIRS